MKKSAMCAGAFALAVAGAALALLGAGCDAESSTQLLSLTPGSAVVRPRESVTFQVSNGYAYRWALEHEEWGVLSPREGDTVTYTAVHDPGTNATASQVIKVTSYIPGNERPTNTTGGTNTATVANVTAEAFITHVH